MEKSLTEVKANIFAYVCTNPSNIFFFFFKACIFLADLQQEYDRVHQLRRSLWICFCYWSYTCWLEVSVGLIEIIIKQYVFLKICDFTVFQLPKIIGQVGFAHTGHATDLV